MYEIVLLNLDTKSRFTKVFFDHNKFYSFFMKVINSKKIKVLSVIDNSFMYD